MTSYDRPAGRLSHVKRLVLSVSTVLVVLLACSVALNVLLAR